MKHSPAEIMKLHAEGAALVDDPDQFTTPLWPAFVSMMPEENNRCVAFYNTTPQLIANLLSGPKLQWEGVQVSIRVEKNAHGAGWFKASQIKAYFEQRSQVSVPFNDETYILHQAYLESGPIDAGREETTRRCLFTLNYFLHLTKAS